MIECRYSKYIHLSGLRKSQPISYVWPPELRSHIAQVPHDTINVLELQIRACSKGIEEFSAIYLQLATAAVADAICHRLAFGVLSVISLDVPVLIVLKVVPCRAWYSFFHDQNDVRPAIPSG
jgi:hypothetical protein